jgi:glutamate carboxypeptidase
MKGAMTQMVMALRVLRDLGHAPLPALTVFGTGDEDVGSVRGRPHIEREGRQCQYVFVVEPARPDGPYVAHRWALAAFYMVAALAERVGVRATQTETRGGGDGSFLGTAILALTIAQLAKGCAPQ